MWQLRCIATWGRPTSRQSFSALITTPIPNCEAAVSLSFLTYNVFTADTLRYAVTLTFDPLTLNVSSLSAVTWSNSVPNFSEVAGGLKASGVENWGHISRFLPLPVKIRGRVGEMSG